MDELGPLWFIIFAYPGAGGWAIFNYFWTNRSYEIYTNRTGEPYNVRS